MAATPRKQENGFALTRFLMSGRDQGDKRSNGMEYLVPINPRRSVEEYDTRLSRKESQKLVKSSNKSSKINRRDASTW